MNIKLHDTDEPRMLAHLNNYGDFHIRADEQLNLGELTGDLDMPPMHILPPSLRYLNTTNTFAVFERPPVLQTVSYTPRRRNEVHDANGERQRFILPLPWTVYAFTFAPVGGHPGLLRVTRAWTFARTSPLEKLNDDLFYLPITNLYSDGSLCLGGQVIGADVGQLFELLYNQLWSGGFNDDLAEQISRFNREHTPDALYNAATLVAQQAYDRQLAVAVREYGRRDGMRHLGEFLPYHDPHVVYGTWENFSQEQVLNWNWGHPCAVSLDHLWQEWVPAARRPPAQISETRIVSDIYAHIFAMGERYHL